MSQYVTSGVPVNLTSSGEVSKVSGTLIGIYVASTTGGTIVVRNGGAAGTAVSGTITPAVGYHPMNIYLTDGCYLTIANTINITAVFAAG